MQHSFSIFKEIKHPQFSHHLKTNEKKMGMKTQTKKKEKHRKKDIFLDVSR